MHKEHHNHDCDSPMLCCYCMSIFAYILQTLYIKSNTSFPSSLNAIFIVQEYIYFVTGNLVSDGLRHEQGFKWLLEAK